MSKVRVKLIRLLPLTSKDILIFKNVFKEVIIIIIFFFIIKYAVLVGNYDIFRLDQLQKSKFRL